MALAFMYGILSKSGMPVVFIICGTLVYYHCVFRHTTLVSLICDVLIVLLCSLAVLGLMFRKLNVSVPVDPLEWQVSEKTADDISASMANTIGAAESVFRVAASGHDKKLLCKVVVVLYFLSVVGRAISGATVVYAGLCLASVLAPLSKLSTDSICQPPSLSR